MNALTRSLLILRSLGPKWVAFRLRYAIRRKAGFLRRASPVVSWEEIPAPALRLHPRKIERSGLERWGAACVGESDEILAGTFVLFSHHKVQAGFPPDWSNDWLGFQRTEDAVRQTQGRSSRGLRTEDRGRTTEGGGQLAHSTTRPLDLRSNPQSPFTAPEPPAAGAHWSDYSDSSHGDIKWVWELSRFSWAFTLARAYARRGDQRYAEGFWRLFGDWMEKNPPNAGPNWMCGQEATFRLMAVVFAAEVFGVPDQRRDAVARFVVASGLRIAANLDYALSQKNNHGVSECVGLITAGLMAGSNPVGLPPLDKLEASRLEEQADVNPPNRLASRPHADEAIADEARRQATALRCEADRWIKCGLRNLQKQLAELVYEDGGFSQHSAIYHRVLLHDLLWCVTRLQFAGEPVPDWLLDAGQRAVTFIATLIDPATGRVPLYGANDGANILPLADADFLDFRPVVQAGFAVFHGRRFLPPGVWDEKAHWLAGARQAEDRGLTTEDGRGNAQRSTFNAQRPTPDGRSETTVDGQLSSVVGPLSSDFQGPVHFADSGILSWRTKEARLLLRCPTHFRHRPSQADMLHVSVWLNGRAVALDGGSFSYNSPERFTRLSDARHHNTLTIDGIEPLRKASRFLYLPWPTGSVEEQGGWIRASHDGYTKLGVRWLRSVAVREKGFVVDDVVTGAAGRRLTWHWLLADEEWKIERMDDGRMNCESSLGRIRWAQPPGATSRLIRADQNSAYGWCSKYYGAVEPAVSLIIEMTGAAEVCMTTEFNGDEPLISSNQLGQPPENAQRSTLNAQRSSAEP